MGGFSYAFAQISGLQQKDARIVDAQVLSSARFERWHGKRADAGSPTFSHGTL